jgi:hypothetical protein
MTAKPQAVLANNPFSSQRVLKPAGCHNVGSSI